MTGYQAAIEDGMVIIIKVDGDSQMDPNLIPEFIAPILVRPTITKAIVSMIWKR